MINLLSRNGDKKKSDQLSVVRVLGGAGHLETVQGEHISATALYSARKADSPSTASSPAHKRAFRQRIQPRLRSEQRAAKVLPCPAEARACENRAHARALCALLWSIAKARLWQYAAMFTPKV